MSARPSVRQSIHQSVRPSEKTGTCGYLEFFMLEIMEIMYVLSLCIITPNMGIMVSNRLKIKQN